MYRKIYLEILIGNEFGGEKVVKRGRNICGFFFPSYMKYNYKKRERKGEKGI